MAHAVSLREAFDDFVADKQYQGVSPATISFYSRNWKHFVRDTGVVDVGDLTGADDGDVHGVIASWCPSALGVAVTPFSVVTADLDLNTMDALQDLARIED